jgi:hypothetical protein
MIYQFPVWGNNLQDQIDNLTYLTAFISCTNNTNKDSRFMVGVNFVTSPNVIGAGESIVFELEATGEGQAMDLNMIIAGGYFIVPVKQNDNTPVIKNGYTYTLTLDYIGGGNGLTDPAAYSAVINEGTKLDIADEIASL